MTFQELDKIITDARAWQAYYTARDIPGADVGALKRVVEDAGDDLISYLFSRDVPGADAKGAAPAAPANKGDRSC